MNNRHLDESDLNTTYGVHGKSDQIEQGQIAYAIVRHIIFIYLIKH